jgi:hypothetical protein
MAMKNADDAFSVGLALVQIPWREIYGSDGVAA